MAHSTSPLFRLPEPLDPRALAALEGFYRWHARFYDWTRPPLLLDRDRVIRGLELQPGERVLDVGCGTGWSLPRLWRCGARPVGIESSSAMRSRAARRLARHGLAGAIPLDASPYGSLDAYVRSADAILFSYSLSMMPSFEAILERAAADLREGGRIGVVDFLDASWPVAFGLRRSHVELGPQRFGALCRRFTPTTLEVRSVGFWRYFVFVGRPRPA